MDERILKVLRQPAPEAAPRLLGLLLRVGSRVGRIVEVEAYTQDDAASHCFVGETPRNRPMFLDAGHIYVYRSYGVHWCLNLVTGRAGSGEAVLVRALEPVEGIAEMRAARPGVADHRMCSGPGNLTRAMGITGSQSGERLGGFLDVHSGPTPEQMHVGLRIGVTRDEHLPRRFCVLGSRSLSRALREGR